MVAIVAVGVRRRVVAFEAPQREVRALRQVHRVAAAAVAASSTFDALAWRFKRAFAHFCTSDNVQFYTYCDVCTANICMRLGFICGQLFPETLTTPPGTHR